MFFLRFKFHFEISFEIILKVIRLKSWFKFDYLKQFLESSRVEKSSKKLIEIYPSLAPAQIWF
jgi:hypothetical protein